MGKELRGELYSYCGHYWQTQAPQQSHRIGHRAGVRTVLRGGIGHGIGPAVGAGKGLAGAFCIAEAIDRDRYEDGLLNRTFP